MSDDGLAPVNVCQRSASNWVFRSVVPPNCLG
jgi:hypothetical protein